MRVLAIDSSGLTATVAVVEETQTVAEIYDQIYKKDTFTDIASYDR